MPPRGAPARSQASEMHGDLAGIFKDNLISGAMLLRLDSGKLHALGVANPFHREALLERISSLRLSSSVDAPTLATTSASVLAPAASAPAALASSAARAPAPAPATAPAPALAPAPAPAPALKPARNVASPAAAGAPPVGSGGEGESALAVALNVLSIAEGLPFAKPVAEAVKLILSGVLNARVNKRACGALGGTVGSLARLMQQALPSLIQGGRTKSDLPFWCDDSFTMPTASLPLARPLPLVVAILRPPTSIALRPPTPP